MSPSRRSWQTSKRGILTGEPPVIAIASISPVGVGAVAGDVHTCLCSLNVALLSHCRLTNHQTHVIEEAEKTWTVASQSQLCTMSSGVLAQQGAHTLTLILRKKTLRTHACLDQHEQHAEFGVIPG